MELTHIVASLATSYSISYLVAIATSSYIIRTHKRSEGNH